jgi:hypothetical protein
MPEGSVFGSAEGTTTTKNLAIFRTLQLMGKHHHILLLAV